MAIKLISALSTPKHIQFQNSSGTNTGKIEAVGDNLVITNAVGDVLFGDTNSDVYIGDGVNNVNIIFEQSGSIKGENGGSATLTVGSSSTVLNLYNPQIENNMALTSTMTIGAGGYIDFTPDTGVFLYFDGQPILERTTANGGLILGHDDGVIIAGGDTSATLKANAGVANELVTIGSEGGLQVLAFPNNDTSWGNRQRWNFSNDGKLYFGTANDTNLYRSAANTLKTDDSLVVSGVVTLEQQQNIPSAGISHHTNGYLYLKGGTAGAVLTNDGVSSAVYVVDNGTIEFYAGSSNKMHLTSGGNLGVGTTSPSSKLHVKEGVSNILIGSDDTYGANYSAIGFGGLSNGDSRIFAGYDGSSTYDDMYYSAGTGRGHQFRVNGTGGTKVMIKSTGDVGIGTTSPQHALDIYSNENVPLRIHRPSNANLNSSGAWGIGFSTRGDTNTSTTDTRAGIFSYYNGNLFLATNSASVTADPDAYARLTVTSEGNVGIGTMSPSANFQVDGSVRFEDLTNGILQVNGSGVLSVDTNAYATQTWVGEQNYASDAAISTALASYLPLAGGTMTGTLKLNDNVRLDVGTSSDLQLFHNGTDSVIQNAVGQLYIQNLSDDKDIILRSDDGSGGVTEYIRLDGSDATTKMSKNFLFYDNVQARFGSGSDLRIYHDGSNSYIDETGSGNLVIRANAQFVAQKYTGETMFKGIADGAVELFYNNVKKFNTSSTGITVTGEITTTSGNSTNWNTAYGWGNHGSAGYLTTSSAATTYAPKASPALTGTPTAPTAGATVNTTQLATTAFVQTAIANLSDSAPATLNTLNELAAALGDDASFSTTVTTSIATKLPLAGGTMTGDLIIGEAASAGLTQAFGSFEQLKFDNSHSDSARGPNKIVMHDNGSAWVGGFGIHSDTVSYYTGGKHIWYKSSSQTAFSQQMSLSGTGTLALTGALNTNTINIGNTVTLTESTDRADLLYINSGTSSWGGLQVGNTSNEFIFSLMGNGSQGGIYDDQNDDWWIVWNENAGVQLKYNNTTRLVTTNTGVSVTGNIAATGDITASGTGSIGGKRSYTKTYGSLNTTGEDVAGLAAGGNGNSALFTFTCHGHSGGYQKIVYSCHNTSATTWNVKKVIDEGTNDFDVTVSDAAATRTFTFVSRSGTKSYSPTVHVEHVGHGFDSTHR